MIVVDRFEGDLAVLEIDGARVDVPRSALPEGTREGDTLSFQRAPGDTAAAEARLARLKARTPQGSGSFDL